MEKEAHPGEPTIEFEAKKVSGSDPPGLLGEWRRGGFGDMGGARRKEQYPPGAHVRVASARIWGRGRGEVGGAASVGVGGSGVGTVCGKAAKGLGIRWGYGGG